MNPHPLAPPALRGSLAAILHLARERHLVEARERADALLASACPEDRAAVEACIAIVEWRTRLLGGAPFDEGLREAIAGITTLERAGCGASLGWVSGNLGYVLGLLGDFEVGLEWLDRAIDDAQQRNDRMQRVTMHSQKATLLAFAQAHGRAFELFKQALGLCRGEAQRLRGGMLNNLAYCQILRARACDAADSARLKFAREALRYADRALAETGSPDYRRWSGTAFDNRGTALGILGRREEAQAAFDEGLRQPGLTPRVQADLLINCAEVLSAAGRHPEAAELLARVVGVDPKSIVEETWDRMLQLQIEVARAIGDDREVQSLLGRRCQHLADRYRDRLRNIGRYSDLHAELKRAQAAIRESRQRERETLLRDLHDGFGSQLASARLAARRGALSQEQLVELLDECMADLYLVVDTLTNVTGSLGDALRFLRNRLAGRLADRPICLHWKIELDDAPPLGQQRLVQALRIVQESIANVLKHAGANNLWIDASRGGSDTFVITVRDDGAGLPAAPTQGLGLSGMRARAAGLGGTLALTGEAGGTRVDLVFPVAAPPALSS